MLANITTLCPKVAAFSTMVKARKIILAHRFDGMPKQSDFELIEEELAPLKDNEFLVEAVYLDVSPYMRAYAHHLPLGSTMVGSQVAKIIESKNEKYPVGAFVLGKFDWRSHSVSSGEGNVVQGAGSLPPPTILPDYKGLPMSYGLGVLGLTGTTAYFGFLEKCRPNKGDTVVVSGAAGAVGSLVGQMAKIKGCRAIGICGARSKGQRLVDELGFDGFVDYKNDDIDGKLAELAPEGVDCYFDNVAGEISTIVMRRMNHFGRISVCGSISSYNHDVEHPPKVSPVQLHMLKKELVMEGFQSYLFEKRFSESFEQNLQWILEKKLKNLETVTKGFENMPKAFIEMLEGKNLGKAIVEM